MSDLDTCYTILQVDPSAEQEVIEAAYRRLSRKYHPDVNDSPEASDRMRAINQAYATLSDPRRRVIYDRGLRQAGIRQRLERLRPDAEQSPEPPTPVDERVLVEQYLAASEPLADRASAVMGDWAAEWSVAVDAVVSGDSRGRRRAASAGQRCVAELSDCLQQWEQLSIPAGARRLADLGAACLKLELALVRGTLSFAEASDFSVLGPLAGLAERIESLARTITAEKLLVARAA